MICNIEMLVIPILLSCHQLHIGMKKKSSWKQKFSEKLIKRFTPPAPPTMLTPVIEKSINLAQILRVKI